MPVALSVRGSSVGTPDADSVGSMLSAIQSMEGAATACRVAWLVGQSGHDRKRVAVSCIVCEARIPAFATRVKSEDHDEFDAPF